MICDCGHILSATAEMEMRCRCGRVHTVTPEPAAGLTQAQLFTRQFPDVFGNCCVCRVRDLEALLNRRGFDWVRDNAERMGELIKQEPDVLVAAIDGWSREPQHNNNS